MAKEGVMVRLEASDMRRLRVVLADYASDRDVAALMGGEISETHVARMALLRGLRELERDLLAEGRLQGQEGAVESAGEAVRVHVSEEEDDELEGDVVSGGIEVDSAYRASGQGRAVTLDRVSGGGDQ